MRLAHHKQSKKQVAIKTLKKKGISDEDLEMLLTEVQVIQEKVVCGVGALQNGLIRRPLISKSPIVQPAFCFRILLVFRR